MLSTDTNPEPVLTVPTPPTKQHSYGQILRSSALIGGSSVINIAIGIVRTKAFAMLLGPAGFGLAGLYGTIVSLAQSVAGLGVNSSGVRQIAAAVGSSNREVIAQTAAVLRWTSTVLGIIGAALMVVFSKQISRISFGNDQHRGDVCLLSLAVLLQLVSAGQGALIQGMRRIRDLAKMGVLGALFGTLTTIPILYFLREKGIALSLVSVALMTTAFSSWYSRRIRIEVASVTLTDVWQEGRALLKLGFAFMASGFLTMGIAYAVRIMLLRKAGFAATGFYQAAWTIGGLYAGFILQAMGADFYPRLTAHAEDNAACTRMVNEQAHVGLLLAGPGVIATLTLAPLVIALFYSLKFGAAVGVLRWICLGTALQVITWPLSFVIVAKGKQALFFVTEFAWAVVSLALAWLCVKAFGLNGAGIAFFGSYIFYGFLLYPIVRRLSGFRWSTANKQTALVFMAVITLVFCASYVLPLSLTAGLGTVGTLLTSLYSVRILSTLVSWERIPRPLRRLFVMARFPVSAG